MSAGEDGPGDDDRYGEPLDEIRSFARHAPGLEFDRVAFFSDAVFAIAMTLLVVGIGIPHVSAARFERTLSDKDAQIFSFFLSFVVIGLFWLSHHRFFATLGRVDRRFMQLNLLFLATIAFMPFPTALVGSYGDRPTAVVLYASTLAAASFLEMLLVWRAQVVGLMRRKLSRGVFRWTIAASLAPVVVFAISVPVAYLVTPAWALYTWILIFPVELAIDRVLKPAGADRELHPRRRRS